MSENTHTSSLGAYWNNDKPYGVGVIMRNVSVANVREVFEIYDKGWQSVGIEIAAESAIEQL